MVEGEPLIGRRTGLHRLWTTQAKTGPESHKKLEEKRRNPKKRKNEKINKSFK